MVSKTPGVGWVGDLALLGPCGRRRARMILASPPTWAKGFINRETRPNAAVGLVSTHALVAARPANASSFVVDRIYNGDASYTDVTALKEEDA